MKGLLEAFLTEVPDLENKIDVGLAANDTEVVRRTAHALTGALGAVGLSEASELASELQLSARDESTDDINSIWPRLSKSLAIILRDAERVARDGVAN